MDIRRGIIRGFESATYLADVQIVGSMATVLTGVPVAKQIEAYLVTSGTKCGVLFFDETNPADACVVFIYGEAHPGHITIPQSKEFRPGGDANTALGEDGSGNAYLKDANVGTKTLKQMASISSRAEASSSLTLTTSEQDIPGASLSLGAGTYIIIGIIDFQGNHNGAIAVGYLDIDGNNQPGSVIFWPDGSNYSRATVAQAWRVTLDSTKTAKLQAKKTGAVGAFSALGSHTTITAIRTGD